MTYFEPFKVSINGHHGGLPYIPLIGTVLRESQSGDPDSIGSCPTTIVLFGNKETTKYKR